MEGWRVILERLRLGGGGSKEVNDSSP